MKYYVVEYVRSDPKNDRVIITNRDPGKATGYLGTAGAVAQYARGEFATEDSAREFVETVLHESRGGVCEWIDPGSDVDVVATYRVHVDVEIYNGTLYDIYTGAL